MICLLPEYNNTSCDITGEPMQQAVGAFARGATGRVCLVMAMEKPEGAQLSTLDEIQEWAESIPNGFLDY